MIARLWIGSMLALMVAGCAAMPISSMWALRKLELETTNFESWRAALKSPAFVRTTTATLKVDLVMADGNNRGESFALIEAPDSLAAIRMVTETRPGEQLGVYRLSDADVAKLERIRADVLTAKVKSNEEGKLGIGVSAQGCSSGLVPSGPVKLSTYLKTSETQRFVPLMEDVDLLKFGKAKTAADIFRPCSDQK
jgi:hypothetical protein